MLMEVWVQITAISVVGQVCRDKFEQLRRKAKHVERFVVGRFGNRILRTITEELWRLESAQGASCGAESCQR